MGEVLLTTAIGDVILQIVRIIMAGNLTLAKQEAEFTLVQPGELSSFPI